MHPDIVCGLDIGGSSIRAVIGRLNPVSKKAKDNFLAVDREEILGYADAHTKGFSKSVVSNLGLLSDAIESAVSKAEEMAHCKVRKVITNVSGVHIKTFQSRGSVHISDMPREITKDDIRRCIESAKLIAMSLDREAVHLVPVRFIIDDKMEIDEPLGLFGSKLDVDLNIITSLVTVLQNVTKAVNLAGYEVDDIVVSGAGTTLALFDNLELEEGVVLLDVGKEITELAVFKNGRLKDCFYFPFGGDDITQVLQDNLKIMFDEAEEFKIKYAVVTKDLSRIDDSEILVPPSRAVVSRSGISNLLFPKIEAVMKDVYKKLEPFLKDKKSLSHIGIIGGASKMDGFIESLEEVFNMPVSMGRIKGDDRLKDISFACSLGLMRYGIRKIAAEKPKQGYIVSDADNLVRKTIAKIKSVVSEYF